MEELCQIIQPARCLKWDVFWNMGIYIYYIRNMFYKMYIAYNGHGFIAYWDMCLWKLKTKRSGSDPAPISSLPTSPFSSHHLPPSNFRCSVLVRLPEYKQ